MGIAPLVVSGVKTKRVRGGLRAVERSSGSGRGTPSAPVSLRRGNSALRQRKGLGRVRLGERGRRGMARCGWSHYGWMAVGGPGLGMLGQLARPRDEKVHEVVAQR